MNSEHNALGKVKSKSQANFFYVLFGTGIPSLAMAFFYLYFASILPQQGYGMVTFYIAAAMTGSSLILLGMDRVLPSVMPKTKDRSIVYDAVFMLLVLGFIAAVFVSLLVSPLAAIILLPEGAFILGQSVLLGDHRYKGYFFFRSTFRLVQVGLAILLFTVMGILGMFMGYAAGLMLPLLYTVSLGAREKTSLFQGIKSNRTFVSRSYLFNITVMASGYLDKIIVGIWFGFLILSYYSLAYQFFWLLEILPTGLLLYLLPERAKGERRREIKIIGLLIAGIVAVSGFLFLPEIVLRVFPQYSEVVPLLQVLCLSTVPSSAASMLLADLLAREMAGAAVIGNLIGSTSHLVLLIVLGSIGLIGLGFAVISAKVILAVTLIAITLYLPDRYTKEEATQEDEHA